MISWRILAPLLTALGGLPIFAFAFIAPSPNEPLYLFGFLYVSFVIAFIAGIDWVIAIEEQKGWFLLWSIILSLIPLAIIAEFIYLQYDNFVLWGQYLLLILLSMLIDWRFFKQVGVSYYLKFRLTGTIVLSLGVFYLMVQNIK